MTNINHTARGRVLWPSGKAVVFNHLFAFLTGVADFIVIIAMSIAVGAGYHFAISHAHGDIQLFIQFGSLIGLFYLVNQWVAKRYEVRNIAQDKGAFRKTFRYWNVAFFFTLCVAFALKEMAVFSRGSVILLYAVGYVSLAMLRLVFARLAHSGLSRGWFASRRVLLLGTEDKISEFLDHREFASNGFHIAGVNVLPEPPPAGASLAKVAGYDAVLRQTADMARRFQVDDILVLIPWSERDSIDHCVEALMNVPAAVHLGPENILQRFSELEISRIGNAPTLRLTRVPLTPLEVATKRIFDIVAASLGLILLAPLFALVAVLIKLDSRGPVFFTQRRHGFNQVPFRIVKFRTMTTADDGDVVPQARPNDPRITRIGHFLRRWNIDELPQLLNVLAGDMSLVGPRPHAVAHNNDYQHRIALYARRHNVKPGITGWAQIHGLRGITDTDDKMRARVEHDLFYIDNWSLWLDLYIIAMTVFSGRAFHNAG